jgi:hypothetical protein
MDELNWGGVVSKVKILLNAWSGRHLSIIGKTNIIRAQVQPLISFVAASQELPEKYEILLTRMRLAFIWGGSDKAGRSLTHKRLNDGSLNVPNYRARALAIQANWICCTKSVKGIFNQVFTYPGIDWTDDNSYNTPFLHKPGNDYGNVCLNAWTENLRLFPFQHSGLI